MSLPLNASRILNPQLDRLLADLRNCDLPSHEVRRITGNIAQILADEVAPFVPPAPTGPHGTQLGLIVVLRSGLAMSDAFMERYRPDVIYHLGIFRDQTSLQPVEYYNKLPNNNTEVKRVIVLDPLIATGGTAGAVVQILRDWGVDHITFVSILASQAGLDNAAKIWPEGTRFVVSAVDPSLNERGYIVPGIGDIGDRLFGTGLSS
ncbi:hypothetical protein VTN31DRAFT_5438 [Thermomyces dupontii]|uniref:uncharacterized protein n=1 Tax=Talaromyces thermophilus TaxID=28565 RepID=UPI003743E843